jgi:hypothetical protein
MSITFQRELSSSYTTNSAIPIHIGVLESYFRACDNILALLPEPACIYILFGAEREKS